MTSPHQEPSEPLSLCHNAPVTVGGRGDFQDNERPVTTYYVCTRCYRPCDATSPQSKGEGEKKFRSNVRCVNCGADAFFSTPTPNQETPETLKTVFTVSKDYQGLSEAKKKDVLELLIKWAKAELETLPHPTPTQSDWEKELDDNWLIPKAAFRDRKYYSDGSSHEVFTEVGEEGLKTFIKQTLATSQQETLERVVGVIEGLPFALMSSTLPGIEGTKVVSRDEALQAIRSLQETITPPK